MDNWHPFSSKHACSTSPRQPLFLCIARATTGYASGSESSGGAGGGGGSGARQGASDIDMDFDRW